MKPTRLSRPTKWLKARIGRVAAEAGLRGLPISRGHSASVALYRYDPASGTVAVLAIRQQREPH